MIPVVWNYGKLSAKFFVGSINVIDTVGFLSFFKFYTRTTIKIPLKLIRFFSHKVTGHSVHHRDLWYRGLR